MAGLGIVLHHGIASGSDLAGYGSRAESAGFDSIWVTERYFHEETFSVLGYLAAATQRIRLGVGVVNPFTRHPGLIAMGAATLDRLSGGRLLLGMGRSEADVIEGRMGLNYDRPRERVRHAVAVIRSLCAGQEVVAREGQAGIRRARLAVLPLQKSVPVYLAAIGPQALRDAGAVADGVLLNAYSPVEYVRYAVGLVRDAASKAGRDPNAIEVACMLPLRLTDGPSTILDSLKRRIAHLLEEPKVGEVLLEHGGFDASILGPIREAASSNEDATNLITEEMVASFYVVGPASQCRRRLAEYRDAGVTMPLLLPLLTDFDAVADAFRD